MKSEVTHSIAVLASELDYSEGERLRLTAENEKLESKLKKSKKLIEEGERDYKRLLAAKVEEILEGHELEFITQLCEKLMPMLGFTKPENFRSTVERLYNKPKPIVIEHLGSTFYDD